MTRDDVIRMAKEAGATTYTNRHYQDRPFHAFSPEQLERFLELAATKERELYKDAVYVAITMLFDSHREDVIRTFNHEDLCRISAHTEALGNAQVEGIYRAAFDKLNAARAKEPTE